MPVSNTEKRFLKNWEEQRKGGKKVFVAIYTFGLFFLIFLCTAALGLFLSIPFVKASWLIAIAIFAIVGGFLTALLMWSRQEKKYRVISERLQAEAN
jgi:cyanate permease